MRVEFLICACLAGGSMDMSEAAVQPAVAVNRLGDGLYGRLADGTGNLVLSPASVTMALAMASAGARGATAKEMAAVLGIPEGGHETFAAWWRASVQGSPEVRIADRLWVASDLPLIASFEALCRDTFGAEIGQTDFADLLASRAAINAWAAERTAGMVPELLAPGALARETRLVLTDAIHFRAPWAQPFEPRVTADQAFHLAGGGTITTATMRQTGTFSYAETAVVQAVRLPYAGGRQVCELYLPRAAADLAAVEALLTGGRLHAWADRWRPQAVRISLPRFALASNADLRPALMSLGMPSAFSSSADFSGITTAERLAIDRVSHGAAIRCDEAGTEAAAATAIMMSRSVAAHGRPAIDFIADHPFMFLIRDTESGAVLFLGRVCDPRG